MTEPSLPEESMFAQAIEITSESERAAFLERACGDNRQLRAEVEALLRNYLKSGDLLDRDDPLPLTTDLPAREDYGTVIGPYKLLEQIGEGGMGTVWMAEQTEPIQRRVAVKIVKEGMDSRQVLARFEAERQALALMDHPHIAKVLDAGRTSSGRPYFVMELVKGKSITKYCDEKRIGVRERLELFGDVCRAVQHAHQKGIIHRDLKPSNVLVAPFDGKPVVKVIDFGVAKATGQKLTDKTLFTGYGAIVGTPEYMSPEQAEINNQDIDTRSDIYSLGVLLYELLTGSTPLTRKRTKEAALLDVLRVIREEDPQRPSTRLSESKDSLPSIAAQRQMEPAKLTKLVRGELDWIVMKALEKDRNRRYDTANGFAMDVQRYLADEQVQACPPSATYRLRKFARRNKGQLAIATGVFLALTVMAASIGWAVRDRIEREAESNRTETARQAQVADRVRESWNTARVLLAENKVSAAQQKLVEAQTQLGNDRSALPDLAAEIEAGATELDRFQRFLGLIDQAHEAETTPVLATMVAADGSHDVKEIPATIGTGRRPGDAVPFLLQALDCYEILQRDDWNTTLEGGLLGRVQIEHIRRSVYGELLWLAQDLAQRQQEHRSRSQLSREVAARKALGYLKKAEIAHPQTTAFYLLRADCHRALGAEADCAADEQLAVKIPPTLALDHDLKGQVAFDAKQLDKAVQAFEAALLLEPTQYWSLMRLGHCLNQLGREKEELARAIWVYTGCILKRPDHAYAYSCRGLVFSRMGQFDKAIADCSRAIELDPKGAKAWSIRGNAYRHLGQFDKALANQIKAIELDPKDAASWSNRGVLYSEISQFDKALADLAMAIELDPNLGGAWHSRGAAYTKMGQFDKALANYSKAIELEPDNATIWLNRGYAYHLLHEAEKAVFDYSKAIELRPQSVLSWNNRGCAYTDLGQFNKAVADCSRAIELDPKCAAAHNNRSIAYRELRQFDKAVADSSRAIELDRTLAIGWSARGSAYLKLRQYDKALADFSEAIKLEPRNPKHLTGRGFVYFTMGQRDKALTDLNEAIELAPTLAIGWIARGSFYLNLGQHDKALLDFGEAVKRLPNNPETLSMRGRTYVAMFQFKNAIIDFGEAIKLEPKNPRHLIDRGDVYFSSGQLVNAIADYSKAIELNQTLAVAYYDRGRAYSGMRQFDKAIADCSKAIELEPENLEYLYFRGSVFCKALGKPEMAVLDFSKLIELHPTSPIFRRDRGNSYRDLRQYDKAIADYSKAIELNPRFADAYNDLAWLFATCPEEQLRDPNRAVDLAKKAVQNTSYNGKFLVTLGMAHYRANDWKGAITPVHTYMEKSKGGNPIGWFILAMSHWKLGDPVEARKNYDQAVQWIEKNETTLSKDKDLAEELGRFRNEAESLLELKKK